jgi:hypothetical protein
LFRELPDELPELGLPTPEPDSLSLPREEIEDWSPGMAQDATSTHTRLRLFGCFGDPARAFSMIYFDEVVRLFPLAQKQVPPMEQSLVTELVFLTELHPIGVESSLGQRATRVAVGLCELRGY